MTALDYNELCTLAERISQQITPYERDVLDSTSALISVRAWNALNQYSEVKQEDIDDLTCMVENRVMENG